MRCLCIKIDVTLFNLRIHIGLTNSQLDKLIEEEDTINLAEFFEDHVALYIDLFALSAAEKGDVLKEDKTKTAVALLLKLWIQSDPFSASFRKILIILLKMGKESIARSVCEYVKGKITRTYLSKQHSDAIQEKLTEIAKKVAHQDKELLSMIQKNNLFKSIIISVVVAIFAMFTYNITSSRTERNTLPRISIPLGPPPLIMTNFHQHKIKTEDVWYSTPVYTHDRGYKICLAVRANGNGQYKGTHVSGHIVFMKGEFDNELKWPFCGVIRFWVFDKLKRRYSFRIVKYDWKNEEGERVVGKNLYSNQGKGKSDYISHKQLKYEFLYNDTLTFMFYYVELL